VVASAPALFAAALNSGWQPQLIHRARRAPAGGDLLRHRRSLTKRRQHRGPGSCSTLPDSALPVTLDRGWNRRAASLCGRGAEFRRLAANRRRHPRRLRPSGPVAVQLSVGVAVRLYLRCGCNRSIAGGTPAPLPELLLNGNAGRGPAPQANPALKAAVSFSQVVSSSIGNYAGLAAVVMKPVSPAQRGQDVHVGVVQYRRRRSGPGSCRGSSIGAIDGAQVLHRVARQAHHLGQCRPRAGFRWWRCARRAPP